MPNYVANAIIVTGEKQDIRKFVHEIFNDNTENGFDFNKLVPMACTLRVNKGSLSDNALILALFEKYGYGPLPLDEPLQRAMNLMYKYGGIVPKKCLSVEEVTKAKQCFSDEPESENKSYLFADGYTNTPKCFKDAVYLGNVMLENIELYGAKDWYDWSCQNWGTKWNALDTLCICKTSQRLVLEFTTAWSYPRGVLTAMAKKYSKLRFQGQYSDEDSGEYNHGEWSGIAGEISETVCSRQKMNAIHKNLWPEDECDC